MVTRRGRPACPRVEGLGRSVSTSWLLRLRLVVVVGAVVVILLLLQVWGEGVVVFLLVVEAEVAAAAVVVERGGQGSCFMRTMVRRWR